MLPKLHLTFRALQRRRGYTLTSIFGLGIGMASCLAIILYVSDELSFDNYHQKSDRIYRLVNLGPDAQSGEGLAKVTGPWGTTAKTEIPEIEEVVRFVFTGQQLVSAGDKTFYEQGGLFADAAVFHVFSFNTLEGNPESALTEPNTVVLTRSFSQKYFGDQKALGQLLRIEDREYRVTGIMDDVPRNSHFRFTFLVSMSSLQHPDRHDWVRWNQFYTYLLLRDRGANASVIAKMKTILSSHLDPNVRSSYTPGLQPLRSIHLQSHLLREMEPNADIANLYIFSSIALLILIISSVNFVNLFTAQAASRAQEIGVRKVNGATRKQLIGQFLLEAATLVTLALVVAHLLLPLALPSINSMAGKELQLDYLNQPMLAGMVIGLGITTVLLAGFYPAFHLSALKPTLVIKGRSSSPGNGWVRKGLVAFQFGLSSILVMGSLIVVQQLNYIQQKPLGFDPQQIINVPIISPTLRSRWETVKQEVLQVPGVVKVSASGNIPGGSDWGIPSLAEGFTQETMPSMRVMAVDHDFLETYGISMSAGRAFSRDHGSDTASYLINEEAARQLQWDQPLARTVSMPVLGRPFAPVVGVVGDFHFRSMHEKIGPLLFMIPPSPWFSQFSIRIEAAQTTETLSAIEKVFNRLDPERPFTYSFFDDTYNRLYQQEQRLSKIVTLFTGISVLLACLGLYSLASLTTEQRTKEIGIRKVIGATNGQIVSMLSTFYLKLVAIGFAVAIPAAWWLAERWLDTFAYRINVSVLLIGASCLVTVAIAFGTVGYRSLQAATANPVDTLRNE